MRRNAVLLCSSLLFLASALASPQTRTPTVAAGSTPVAKSPTPREEPAGMAIAKLASQFSDAFNRGDISAVGAFYADTAVALPPDGDFAKGRPAIEKVWSTARDKGMKSMKLNVVDVVASGILAVEMGTAELEMKPANQRASTQRVKYVAVWQKQKEGGWKLIRDIWNSMPAGWAPAKATTPKAAPRAE